MRRGRRGAGALLAAVAAGMLVAASGSASTPGMPRQVALASLGDGRSIRMFTTQFCEPGRCMDAAPGIRRSGGASLPVLTGAPGRRLTFDLGFAASSLRLTVGKEATSETTSVLPSRGWDVPADLALPAWIRLEAEGAGTRATFLALLDHVAPAPVLDQARKRRVAAATGQRLFEIRFRLCSMQAGKVFVTVGERRRGGLRTREMVAGTHDAGCASYRLKHRSLWRLQHTPSDLELAARVGDSERSEPLRLR